MKHPLAGPVVRCCDRATRVFHSCSQLSPANLTSSSRIRNIASSLFPVLFGKTGANLKESP
jgi:hypothetical protein